MTGGLSDDERGSVADDLRNLLGSLCDAVALCVLLLLLLLVFRWQSGWRDVLLDPRKNVFLLLLVCDPLTHI